MFVVNCRVKGSIFTFSSDVIFDAIENSEWVREELGACELTVERIKGGESEVIWVERLEVSDCPIRKMMHSLKRLAVSPLPLDGLRYK